MNNPSLHKQDGFDTARKAALLNSAYRYIKENHSINGRKPYADKQTNTVQTLFYGVRDLAWRKTVVTREITRNNTVQSPTQHKHIGLLQQSLLALIRDNLNDDNLMALVYRSKFELGSASTMNAYTSNVQAEIDTLYKIQKTGMNLGCTG